VGGLQQVNAFNNLARYQQALPSFNDDIQGTGAVVLAGIIGAVKSRETLGQQHTWSTGPGLAGSGWRIRSARG
jgi:malate dehydrogenase (oxaloacetate-decarboxylating)